MSKLIASRIQHVLEHDDDTAIWFQAACERGPDYLTAQAWQFGEVLATRGTQVTRIILEDSLLELAHELLSDSPAGKDPHSYLFNRVARWIGSRPFLATDAEDAALNEAFYATLPEFREVLRVWVKAGLEAGKREAA